MPNKIQTFTLNQSPLLEFQNSPVIRSDTGRLHPKTDSGTLRGGLGKEQGENPVHGYAPAWTQRRRLVPHDKLSADSSGVLRPIDNELVHLFSSQPLTQTY